MNVYDQKGYRIKSRGREMLHTGKPHSGFHILEETNINVFFSLGWNVFNVSMGWGNQESGQGLSQVSAWI